VSAAGRSSRSPKTPAGQPSRGPGAPITPPSGAITSPGLGASQRALLEALKRRGEATLAELEGAVELAAETVRSHLQALVAQRLVERSGVVRAGAGRPRIRYRLAEGGEALFPRRERELLAELARFLIDSGRGALLEEFFAERLARKRADAEARLAGVPESGRLEAVARLLSEEGFLAEVADGPQGPRLRLAHCPLRELVEVSRLPCRAEMALVGGLLGQTLHRESFIPDGAPACTYAAGPIAPTRAPSRSDRRPGSDRS